MIINIIVGAIILGCVVGIVIIALKKFGQIKQVDTSLIQEERQSDVKDSLLEQRLARKFKTFRGFLEKIFHPAGLKIAVFFKSLKEKVLLKARHYSERSRAQKIPSLEEKEETRQKVNRLLVEAGELYKAQNWPEAEKKYLEVIGLDIRNVEAYEFLGLIYFEMKDFEHAKETFDFVKKLDPKNDEVYIYLGESLWMMNKREEALLNFKEAVRLSPNNPKNLDTLLSTAIEMGDKYLANSTFDKLKQVNPENQKLLELEKQVQEMGKK